MVSDFFIWTCFDYPVYLFYLKFIKLKDLEESHIFSIMKTQNLRVDLEQLFLKELKFRILSLFKLVILLIYTKTFESIFEKASSKSFFKSSIFSSPTDNLIKSLVTPVEACSSGPNC